MTSDMSPFSELRGYAETSCSATRPHLRTDKPILDPAHASFMAKAVAAARHYSGTVDSQLAIPIGVTVGLPLPLGSPLVASAKVVIDALVVAGVVSGDTYDFIRALRFLRHSPEDNPRTCVWFGDINDQGVPPAFEFYGTPAAPLYVPPNDNPRFRYAPSTPSAYRRVLRESFSTVEGDPAYILRPTPVCAVGIRVFGPTPIDLDNVGLCVLDALELLRPQSEATLLLDEILHDVRVVYGGEASAPCLEFTFQDLKMEIPPSV